MKKELFDDAIRTCVGVNTIHYDFARNGKCIEVSEKKFIEMGKEEEQLVKIDTRVKKSLEQQIRLEAKQQGRSFSGQIRWMLEAYYKAQESSKSDPYNEINKISRIALHKKGLI